MIAERDIAGFALPFTTGIMVTSLFGTHQTAISHMAAIASILTAAACISFLTHPSHHNWSHIVILSLTMTAAFTCGIMTGTTHSLSSIGIPTENGIITDRLSALGDVMKARIDSLPFNSSNAKGILKALVTGDRSDISKTTLSTFRESGASHILALSGLHLGIIYSLISYLLSFLGNSPSARKARSTLIICLCGIYTAATGAGPSISRAFLFIILGEAATISGRHKSTGGILFAALTIQLTLSPERAAETGFQLSYAAMAGIAFIYPRLQRIWPDGKGGIMKRIWNCAAMSIACQITTGPLTCIYFGSFAHHFLLTNIIALPLTGLIIPSILLTMSLDTLNICPDILYGLTESLVTLLEKCLQTIATM